MRPVLDSTFPGLGYWIEDFDNWNDAFKFQLEKLRECVDKGWPIRALDIVDETDFDTKIWRVRVFVRPFMVEVVNETT